MTDQQLRELAEKVVDIPKGDKPVSHRSLDGQHAYHWDGERALVALNVIEAVRQFVDSDEGVWRLVDALATWDALGGDA